MPPSGQAAQRPDFFNSMGGHYTAYEPASDGAIEGQSRVSYDGAAVLPNKGTHLRKRLEATMTADVVATAAVR